VMTADRIPIRLRGKGMKEFQALYKASLDQAQPYLSKMDHTTRTAMEMLIRNQIFMNSKNEKDLDFDLVCRGRTCKVEVVPTKNTHEIVITKHWPEIEDSQRISLNSSIYRLMCTHITKSTHVNEPLFMQVVLKCQQMERETQRITIQIPKENL